MKTCSLCKRDKPLDSFYKHSGSKDGRRGECRSCVCHKAAERLKGEPIEKKEYRARWKKEYNSRPARQAKLYSYSLARYGLTSEDYERMLKDQGFRCKICPAAHDLSKKHCRLYVDHCHTTGKVRGLLCQKCNSLIGFAREDAEVLSGAIAYLKSA
jgi:hypothetical protein